MSELRHRKTTEDVGARERGKESDQRMSNAAEAGMDQQTAPAGIEGHGGAQDMSDFSKEGVRLLLRRFYERVNKGSASLAYHFVHAFLPLCLRRLRAKLAPRSSHGSACPSLFVPLRLTGQLGYGGLCVHTWSMCESLLETAVGINRTCRAHCFRGPDESHRPPLCSR